MKYPCLSHVPHHGQINFVRDKSKKVFLIGGKRSGKTEVGAWKASTLALGIHPFIPIPIPNAGWVCSTDHNISRDVLQPRVISMIGEDNILDWSELHKELYLKNGSLISFKSYDSRWEKFRSAGKHWIWFDEEPPERIFKESIIRFITNSPYVWVTMTPENGITYVYKKFFCNREKTKTSFHFLTTFQNPYLSQDEIMELRGFYSADEEKVFLYGEFFALSGLRIFDLKKYNFQSVTQLDKPDIGFLYAENKRRWNERIKFKKNDRSDLKIYSHPQPNNQYFIGCDVGEGLQDGSFSAVEVIDRNLNQVAEYCAKISPDELADIVYLMGRYYNNALTGIERNNHGLTTISFLKIHYPLSKLWSPMDVIGKKDVEEVDRIGWETNVKTRALLINYLRKVVKDNSLSIVSSELLSEMQNFIRDEKNRVGAETGFFDDRIIAIGIAVAIWFEKIYGRSAYTKISDGGGETRRRRIDMRKKVWNFLTGY